MNNPPLLEAVNRGVVVLITCMAFLFVRFAISEIRVFSVRRYRLRGAVSLILFLVGELIKSGSLAWVRSRANSGLDVDWVGEHHDRILIAGSVVMFLAAVYFIKIWSPEVWGEWPWISAGIVALTFSFADVAMTMIVAGIICAMFQLRKQP